MTDVSIANHGQHLLHVKVLYGEIKEGDVFLEKVDWNRRNKIRKNHSATHLLQKALQEIISPEIHQEGAYYDDERLRAELDRIIRHELTHHWESLSGTRDLEIYDSEKLEEYRNGN